MNEVLIVKPDGYASPLVMASLDKLVNERGLAVVDRYRHDFDEGDVLDTWPKFGTPKYPISLALSVLYMGSGPSEVLVVSGERAVDALASIKRDIRKLFGAGMFCNSIHVPSGEIERQAALDKFGRAIPQRAHYTRHADEGETAGIAGRLAQTPLAVLRDAARAVWNRKACAGWRSVKRPLPNAAAGAYLLGGDPHSIDFGMSVLADVFESWSCEEILSAYLDADVHGRGALFAGESRDVDNIVNEIRRLGMFAEAVPCELAT